MPGRTGPSASVAIRLGRSARLSVVAGRVTGDVDGRHDPADAGRRRRRPVDGRARRPVRRWRPIRPLWGVVVETLLASPPGHVIEEAAMDVALGTGAVAAVAGAASEGPASADVASADVASADVASVDVASTPQTSLVTAGGATAVGSTFLDDEPDPPAWTERILARAATFVPAVADAPIRETRACARPLAADGRPLVGRVPWVDGLFLCSGHGPWGITTGPASARQVADLVLGRARPSRPRSIPRASAAARTGASG
jgi:hypothetical protein